MWFLNVGRLDDRHPGFHHQTSRVSPSDIQGFTITWKGVGDMLLDELMRYMIFVVLVPLLHLGLHTLLSNQYFRWESLFVQNKSVSGD